MPSKSLVLALPNVTCQGWTETRSVLLQLRSVLSFIKINAPI